MKKTSIFFGSALLCASMAFISCSNDDDALVNPQEEGLTTITVGAPTISADDSDTRVALSKGDPSGIDLTFEANDAIKITPYGKRSGGAWGPQSTKDYTTTGGGEHAVFTAATAAADDQAYCITFNGGNGKADDWLSQTTTNSQTQAGNDNIAHLKSLYRAALMYVTKKDNISFSSEWALANKFVPTDDATDGTGAPAAPDCGKFVQSSVLKLDLTLPKHETFTQIKKILLKKNGNTGSKLVNMNDGTTEKDWTLIVTGLDNIDGNTTNYHFVGYIMLPACDQTIAEKTKWEVDVYYNDSQKNYKQVQITNESESKTIKAGTLVVLKLSSTGWKDNSGATITE